MATDHLDEEELEVEGADEADVDSDYEGDAELDDDADIPPISTFRRGKGIKRGGESAPGDEEDEDEEEEEEDEEEDEDEGEDEEDEDEDEDQEKDEDEEDEDEEDEKSNVRYRTTAAVHQAPESINLTISPPTKRVTSEHMTLYEYAMVVGHRATHIASGSALYTDAEGLDNERAIAQKEIREGMCPLSITRRVAVDRVEIWEVNEMIKPDA